LLQVDDGCGEQSLNLNAGSPAELSPLETVLGLKVGHDSLAYNLSASESTLSQTAGDMNARAV